MSFISPEFIIFAVVVLPLYFLAPFRARWPLLLIASYLFYAYGHVEYIALIAFSTTVDYFAARGIHASGDPRRRRALLLLSVTVNLGLLFVFKYFNFAVGSLTAASDRVGVTFPVSGLELVLPIGISFYTFQSMAYTIDVYRGRIAPERHFGIMATFIAFFPQLVAGPIERAENMLPQFRQHFRFDPDRTISGLRLILWGMFKKVVIADRLAIYVTTVYDTPQAFSGPHLMLATAFFAFQVYCDFSAYSDIAIGTARIMGFTLMENFRQPYFAKSIREYWARWHISLTTWFRDYLYIPLGGSRVSFPRYLLNLFIVFLVSGLWHGAGWTFVVFGMLHGLVVVIEATVTRYNLRVLPAHNPPYAVAIKIGFTFALLCVLFVCFRALTFSDALYIWGHLLDFSGAGGGLSAPFAAGILEARVELVLSIGLIALLLAVDAFSARVGFDRLFTVSPALLRWAVYYALGGAVIFSGLYGTGAQEFIYFQF
ncbi:MAG: MBOAT family protein [Chloroflexi bacterium]|nr:MBOAT family protein [Chloroflexota bacterium]